jgi:hypothetical protein
MFAIEEGSNRLYTSPVKIDFYRTVRKLQTGSRSETPNRFTDTD